jgi:hypothetical protein
MSLPRRAAICPVCRADAAPWPHLSRLRNRYIGQIRSAKRTGAVKRERRDNQQTPITRKAVTARATICRPAAFWVVHQGADSELII